MKVLIIEDDYNIASQIEKNLKANGFVCHIEHDGVEGHYQGEIGSYDAVILDLGLPNIDGMTILEKWRNKDINFPVLVLTARTSKQDIINGLEMGADDYITKPFDIDELSARLRTIIRRSKGQTAKVIKVGDIEFDLKDGRILKSGHEIKLTRIEYLLTQYLFMNLGKTISVNELVEHIYDDFDNDSGIIARHVANVRKKIGSSVILTDSNRGYFIPKENIL